MASDDAVDLDGDIFMGAAKRGHVANANEVLAR